MHVRTAHSNNFAKNRTADIMLQFMQDWTWIHVKRKHIIKRSGGGESIWKLLPFLTLLIGIRIPLHSGATRGGGESSFASPSCPPPHLTPAWSWLWTIFLSNFANKEKIPRFSRFRLKESQSFLIYPLRKPVHMLLLMSITIHISYNVTQNLTTQEE